MAVALPPPSQFGGAATVTSPVLAPHDEARIVKDADELIDVFFEQQTGIWDEYVAFWNYYFAHVEDTRTEDEKLWRSNVFPPKPQINTESKTAVIFDITTSLDSMIQAEGVGEEDEDHKAIERWFGYQNRKVRFRKKLPPMLRGISVQGTEFMHLYWAERRHTYAYTTTPQDMDDFQRALMDAVAKGAPRPVPDPVADPQTFAVWRDLVERSGKGKIPDPPITGKRFVQTYRGPMLERLSPFDVWLDPAVQEMEDQEAVFKRIVKSSRWWKSQAGPEPWQPFDPMKVAEALNKSRAGYARYSDRETTHRNAIYDILNISPSKRSDPMMEDLQEGFECFFAGDVLGEYPHIVLLNGMVVNKMPHQMPFMHGRVPIFGMRNLVVPGTFHGISDYRPVESLFLEGAKFRRLRQDGLTISLLPVIAKLASISTPELMKRIVPGMIVPVPRLDGYSQLFQIRMPEAAFQEPREINDDVDESMAVYSAIRGQTSTIGRVPATTEQNRMTQAISRLKLVAAQFEEDMWEYAPQSLALLYEFGDQDLRVKVGGKDPFISLPKHKILEAMEQDYVFAGATRAINREAMAVKLMEFGKVYAANLTPAEMRVLMAEVIEATGVRKASRIVSPEGTTDAVDAYEIKKRMAKMQAAMAEFKQQAGAAGAKAPGSVGPAAMQAIAAEGGAPDPGAGAPAAPPEPPPA